MMSFEKHLKDTDTSFNLPAQFESTRKPGDIQKDLSDCHSFMSNYKFDLNVNLEQCYEKKWWTFFAQLLDMIDKRNKKQENEKNKNTEDDDDDEDEISKRYYDLCYFMFEFSDKLSVRKYEEKKEEQNKKKKKRIRPASEAESMEDGQCSIRMADHDQSFVSNDVLIDNSKRLVKTLN